MKTDALWATSTHQNASPVLDTARRAQPDVREKSLAKPTEQLREEKTGGRPGRLSTNSAFFNFYRVNVTLSVVKK
jgi:hypothetical protein